MFGTSAPTAHTCRPKIGLTKTTPDDLHQQHRRHSLHRRTASYQSCPPHAPGPAIDVSPPSPPWHRCPAIAAWLRPLNGLPSETDSLQYTSKGMPRPAQRPGVLANVCPSRHLSHKRAKRNTTPNTSLLQIEGVGTKEAARYAGHSFWMQ